MRPRHIVAGVLFAAVFGLVASAVLIQQATDVEHVPKAQALSRLEAIRARFGEAGPMLVRDASGRFRRAQSASAPPPDSAAVSPRPRSLNLLVYRPGEDRLARTRIPFWFVKLKGPAFALALRGSSLDLGALGVTAGDLERHGPGLVVDVTGKSGDRVLLWLE